MRLKVKVKNTDYKYRHRYASYVVIPEFNIYVGRVVSPRPSWLSPNEFMLTTSDIDAPVRILDKNDIVEAWTSDKDVDDGVTLVAGEKRPYVVTRGMNGKYSCNCSSYGYRKWCSHINEVKKNGKRVSAQGSRKGSGTSKAKNV
jgi:hypothetical protein